MTEVRTEHVYKLMRAHCDTRYLTYLQELALYPLHHNYHSLLYLLKSPKLWYFKFDTVCLQLALKCNAKSIYLDSIIHPEACIKDLVGFGRNKKELRYYPFNPGVHNVVVVNKEIVVQWGKYG